MDEPSVLDYVKAKLAFWRQPADEGQPREAGAAAAELPRGAVSYAAPAEEAGVREGLAGDETILQEEAGEAAMLVYRKPRARFPWLPLAALILALIGQILLEPPDRPAQIAVFFYVLASAAILFAFYRREISPTLPLPPEPMADDVRFHWEGVLVGVVLMGLTFLTFGAPQGEAHDFNFINTALWLLSIAYLVWAFWIPHPGATGVAFIDRFKRFLARPVWKINITRWAVLLLVVTGIILFYRWYRLAGVPAEMVSDHAEKLLDIQDVLNGQLHVFFPRNTGREFFQFYWTVLMIKLFSIPVSFMALKVGTVLAGLIALIYIYRLGFELGNKWIALFALAFCGISYWANIIARIGLRFTLYPLFAAPLLFYMIRGIRTSNRNDFIKAGLALGLGLHGYTSFRVVPLIVLAGFVIYILHERTAELRKRAWMGLAVVTLVSLAVFMPLLRYAVDNPEQFGYRTLTRIGSLERPLPGSPVAIFAQNTANALLMFQWDDGDVWVHSIPHRPALDVASAALFFLGVLVLLARYVRRRCWIDLFLLLSIPLFLLPSILSLAFPNENPNLNRTAGAYIPAFLILGLMLDALVQSLRRELGGRMGLMFSGILVVALFAWSAWQNYDLVFVQYDSSFKQNAWNSTEMGAEVSAFERLTGSVNNAYVVAYPYWVDTRLVGVEAGHPDRDLAIQPDQLGQTQSKPGNKLFLLKPEDSQDLAALQQIYPAGRWRTYASQTPGKDFVEFLVLGSQVQQAPEPGPQ